MNIRSLFMILAAFPAAFISGLLVIVVWMSLGTAADPTAGYGSSYITIYADPFAYHSLLNTAVFSAVTTIVALAIGVTVAWLAERTDIPGKPMVYILMTIGVLIPPYLRAMGWVILAHQRVGLLNAPFKSTLGFLEGPFHVGTLPAMGVIQGLGLASVAFIIMGAVVRAMNPALEDASAVHGIGILPTLFKITIPVLWPGILAAGIYILVIGISAFEIPAFIGLGHKIYTFSTFIATTAIPDEELPRYDLIGAMGVFMVILAILLSWWYFRVIARSHYRYAVVSGQGYRPNLISLGRWRTVAWGIIIAYFLAADVLPLLAIGYVSLLPYLQPISVETLSNLSLKNYEVAVIASPTFWRAARNTAILVVTVPTVTIFFGFTISWLVLRSGMRGIFILDSLAFLPHAIPSIILATSSAFAALFILRDFVPIYGTIFILLMVYALRDIAFVTRSLNSALIQIHYDLDDASYTHGISKFVTIRKIIVPLLAPAMINIWLWIALLTYREVTMAVILTARDNITLPMLVWGFWSGGRFGQASAVGLLSLIAILPLSVLYWITTKHRR